MFFRKFTIPTGTPYFDWLARDPIDNSDAIVADVFNRTTRPPLPTAATYDSFSVLYTSIVDSLHDRTNDGLKLVGTLKAIVHKKEDFRSRLKINENLTFEVKVKETMEEKKKRKQTEKEMKKKNKKNEEIKKNGEKEEQEEQEEQEEDNDEGNEEDKDSEDAPQNDTLLNALIQQENAVQKPASERKEMVIGAHPRNSGAVFPLGPIISVYSEFLIPMFEYGMANYKIRNIFPCEFRLAISDYFVHSFIARYSQILGLIDDLGS